MGKLVLVLVGGYFLKKWLLDKPAAPVGVSPGPIMLPQGALLPTLPSTGTATFAPPSGYQSTAVVVPGAPKTAAYVGIKPLTKA